MAPFAPGRATEPLVPMAFSSSFSGWCARLVLGGVALVLAIQMLLLGSPAFFVGRTMPASSAIVLGVLATGILAALCGRIRMARTASLVSVLLGGTLMLMAGLALAGVTGSALGEVAVPGWRAAGSAAAVHALLGVALLATLRPSRRLVPLRALGLATGVLAPLVSLSVLAVGGEGSALVPGVVPLSVTVAVATLLTTLAVVGLAPDRWPLRTVLEPFVLLVPFVAPLVLVLTRTMGLEERATIVLATLLPMLALAGLLVVAVRGRHRLLGEIATRDQQLLTVLDGLPVAVMVRAQDGTLLHFNPGTEAFVSRLGVGLEAIRGSASDLMAHVEVVDEDERPFDRDQLPVVSAVRDGRTHDATVGHGLPEGGYAWYSVRAAPIPLTDGSTGTIVTLDDITEHQDARLRITVAERALRGLNEELNEANLRLEEAARFKDDLLSMASHELRTPLTPILGFLEILEARGDVTVDQRQLLQVVSSNAERMLRLVDDFLAVGSASAGVLVGQPQEVSVEAALRGALHEVGDLAGQVDLAVAGCRAIVDPQHLEQIVLNLLANATKYGAPPLTVTAKHAGEGRIALEVADHGAGVPPDFQQHMWDRFVQKDRGDRRTATGVGLGLPIVRLLAESNGGTVSYRDGSRTGAVFTVELPGTFQPDPAQTPTCSTTRPPMDTLATSSPVGQPPKMRPGAPPRSADVRTEGGPLG